MLFKLLFFRTLVLILSLLQDTGNWVPCGETGPDPTEFQVKGLTPNHKYKFRVRAVNKEGESEPLEADSFILAKNPYGKWYNYYGSKKATKISTL